MLQQFQVDDSSAPLVLPDGLTSGLEIDKQLELDGDAFTMCGQDVLLGSVDLELGLCFKKLVSAAMVNGMPVMVLNMGVLDNHHGGGALSPRDPGACSQTQHLCCGHILELELSCQQVAIGS